MAPSRTSTVKNKYRSKTTKTPSKDIGSTKSNTETSKVQKSKNTKTYGKHQKNVSGKVTSGRKRKVYTEKELNIPALNMITPIGVQKPKGQKKGKIFVDDRESMLTILSIVDAEKSNLIESKMMKARQLEEIREARRVENEKKQELKKENLTELKESMRKKRKRLSRVKEVVENSETPGQHNIKQKNVSFA